MFASARLTHARMPLTTNALTTFVDTIKLPSYVARACTFLVFSL